MIKGSKQTKEAKEKNRLSHLGKTVSEETKQKMSATMKIVGVGKWNKGKIPWNKGTKGVMKAWNKGLQVGWNRGLKSVFAKEKHWNWKGGITLINDGIRHSLEYKRWRTSVFERDDYTCVWCGARNGLGKTVVLNADHIKQFSDFPELRLEVSNGRTLCRPCHETTFIFKGNQFTKINNRLDQQYLQ